jgi:hypothetical protein
LTHGLQRKTDKVAALMMTLRQDMLTRRSLLAL